MNVKVYRIPRLITCMLAVKCPVIFSNVRCGGIKLDCHKAVIAGCYTVETVHCNIESQTKSANEPQASYPASCRFLSQSEETPADLSTNHKQATGHLHHSASFSGRILAGCLQRPVGPVRCNYHCVLLDKNVIITLPH